MVITHLPIEPIVWIGSTRADLSAFPGEVKDAVGYALYVAQQGGKRLTQSPCAGSAAREFWRLLRITTAIHTALCIPFAWLAGSTPSTLSRRSRKVE
jgi:hypothetical protein